MHAIHYPAPHRGARAYIPPERTALDVMINNRHILVVDDEVEIATFVAEILRDEGYRVRIAHDGGSALMDIMQHPPALVMLDIAMPVMVGDDVLRFLRRNGYGDLPVVIMTAGLHPEIYRRSGATEVLPKPFDIDTLLEIVAEHMPQS
jgi:CheY-like chemotaxis protein